MAQSFSQNCIHLIFSTKNREPLLEPAVQERLYAYLVGAFSGQGEILATFQAAVPRRHWSQG